MPNNESVPVERLAIIGVGLMGGSLAMAARQLAGVREISGYDVEASALEEAHATGVITRVCSDLEEAAAGADLVVVCTPVRAIPDLVDRVLRVEPAPRLVSDIGSTKAGIIASVRPHLRSRFIGGHPICGAETSGVRFSRPNLYRQATYFLCPTEEVPAETHRLLHAFVSHLGARPVVISGEAHDRIVALVSHLPHVLANSLMSEVGGFEAAGRRALYSVGPSFKDLTRVAGANPPMWRDIFFENRDALAGSLRRLVRQLESFCDLLDAWDEEGVLTAIGLAAGYRQELLKFEDIVPESLYRVTARIPDVPGVLSRVMAAMGSAHINIEDMTLHHFNRDVGGDLVLYVSGGDAASTACELIGALGYPVVFAAESSV